MRSCANCGHENRPGVFFCENCGASLIGKAARDTNSLQMGAANSAAGTSPAASVTTDARVEGRSIVREGDKLKLDVEGSPEPVTVSAMQEIIFGRRDPATGALPDVDLTPHAGYRMGVSRRHAAIRPGAGNTLDLWDLGSSNGTFLNGQRLSAHRPYRLHDGDELRLGQMAIRVRFEAAAEGARVLAKPGESGAAPGPALEAEAQKEPPSTEPIYALIAMLRDQDAAAETSGVMPTTEPLPEPVKDAPATEKPPEAPAEQAAAPAPAAEKPAEPAASEHASAPPVDKIATEEAAPVAPAPPAEGPASTSEHATPPSAPVAPPAPLAKSSNGPTAAAEIKPAPNAVPIFPATETPTAPRNGQAPSVAPASPTPAAPETKAESEDKAESAPPAATAKPVPEEKPPDTPDTPKPPTPAKT